MNPLSNQVDIPFRHGSVRCTMNLAGIIRAETDLNIAIISPSKIPFGERPVMVQMNAYLYALLSSVDGLNPTIEEVTMALVGKKAAYITAQISKVMPALTVQLEEYSQQFQPTEASGTDPLAE
jgi:hypothetical protein